MTTEFRYMMHLAGCAALGKSPEEPPEGLDWEKTLRFANEQTVRTLVQYAIKTAPFAIPDEIRKSASARLNQTAMQALIRRIGILRVLQELEKQGITAAVIKGFAIARDYAQPDVRISGDADIYIDEKDEERALAVFEQFGFAYTPRGRTDKDTVLTHPKYGMVELHVRLFEDFVDHIWHDGVGFELLEPYQRVETKDGLYDTLGDTDHFLFVLEHTMKHFVAEGLSLRMLMDVGVLLLKRGERMDVERIAAFLKQRRYETVVKAFLHILREYCGFPVEGLWSEQTQQSNAVSAILEDMESGGVRGFKHGDSNTQKDGLRIYNFEKQKRDGKRSFKLSQIDYWDLLRVIFPPMDVMREKYPCLKKAGILYPVMWCHRAIKRGGYHMREKDLAFKNWQFAVDGEKLEANEGTKRADLFRMLEMM